MKAEKIKLKNLKENWIVFLMLAPTVIGIAIFSYVPAIEAIRHSFYRWDGAFIEEFIGWDNFRKILGNISIWFPLLIGGILAGLSALIEGKKIIIILRTLAALILSWTFFLLYNDAQLFVHSDKGSIDKLMPSFIMLGVALICLLFSFRKNEDKVRNLARFGLFFLPMLAAVHYLIYVRGYGDHILWMSFNLIGILIVANLFKMWPAIFAAVCIHRLRSEKWQYFYRVLFVVPLIIPQMVGLLIWKFFYDPNVGPLNKILVTTGIDKILMWMDKWVFHLGVFNPPFKPAWLGDPSLIIPALIFWGFPWVGVVGVLIYLAGLQNISNDVYEAAEIDGVGWWKRFTCIEFPLIMTQIRLNLVLMIIGTFQAYGFQLILLGVEGGPRNKGMTPGLYMFYQAFNEQKYGYACSIGLILFFIILILTIINQRYVRIQK